jgi:hypothetical protein
VLVGLTREQIRDTVSKIKFNHTVYTIEMKEDGDTKFRRLVKRAEGFTPRKQRANSRCLAVDGTSEPLQAVNSGTNRSGHTVKRMSRSCSTAIDEFFDQAKKHIKEGKLLSNCSRFTVSPTSIARIFVLLEREMATLREKLGKE